MKSGHHIVLGGVIAGTGLLAVGCDVPGAGPDDDSAGTTGGPTATEDGDDAGHDSSTGGDSEDTSGDGSSGDGEETTGAPVEPYEFDIEWTPCSLYTGGAGSDAECAEVPLPIDWSDPQGPTLTTFVKRIGNPDGDKQLWMLMGGPGGSGAGFESDAETFVEVDDQLVVYLPDHRGVGRSTRLGCPEQEAETSDEGLRITNEEWPDCMEFIRQTFAEALPHFNTSSAATDLGWLIEQLRGAQAVHVFGGSYGTYWGHRYLQINPEQPDSITLLGIAPPDFNFVHYAEQYDQAGRQFMDLCSEDALCQSKLGPDAQGAMEQIMAEVDEGLCPGALAAGLDRQTLKLFFSSRLSWTWDERALIPAVLYRLLRCSPQDVAALTHAAPLMMNPLAALFEDPLFSSSLNVHISLSEMWHPPVPTVEEALEAEAEALFGLSTSTRRIMLADEWPTYEPDEYAQTYATNDVPMLMMNGQFDPNTPLSLGEEFAQQFTGEHQHFLELPGGNHTWDSPTSAGYGCGINVFFSFIQDPTQPLLDCIDDVLPMNFAGPPGLAAGFFGTATLYEE